MEALKQKSRAGVTTGSFFNYLMGNNQSVPVVGKGATVLHWTDRSAYEVMSVSEDGKRVVIQQYNAKRIDSLGMSECQDYEYKELNGFDETIVYRNGAWRKEIEEIEFIDHDSLSREQIKSCFDEKGNIRVVEGLTKVVKRYPKINILFGVKKEYYDYSF